MNKILSLILLLSCSIFIGYGQTKEKKVKADSIAVFDINEVVITAPRIPYKLKSSPFSISLVGENTINTMAKTIDLVYYYNIY